MIQQVKKATAVVSATVVAGMLAFSATGCGGNGIYKPGVYTGEGRGISGAIEVTLTVDDNAIVSVDKITDPGESAGMGGKEAIEDGTFADQIMEAQSAEIDGIAGATLTSDGVRAAVKSALEQAAV